LGSARVVQNSPRVGPSNRVRVTPSTRNRVNRAAERHANPAYPWHALGYFENAFNARDQARCPLSRDDGEDLLKVYMSEDFREGMDASLNKRAPNFKAK
jgi:1,4-dihydroxy-2-naphthoyl-CoA synthase